MNTPRHSTLFFSLFFYFLISLASKTSVFAQFNSLNPQSGQVYKEFYITNYGNRWRVTDPETTSTQAQAYLPNPVIQFNIDDLTDAIRAEVVLDVWGGHPGTTEKQIRFNGQEWINVPELLTTPTNGQCYMQQVNYLLDVPISELSQGNNTIEATSGGQTCYDFNWGQWGLYGLVIRIYYDPGKPHSSGEITSLESGDIFTDNPTISVATKGDVGKIEILAKYEGYDIDGDGYYYDWARSYHRTSNTEPITIGGHVGSMTTAPYTMVWDTEWVPDQNVGAISLMARIQDNNGYYFVSDLVEDLSLSRATQSVRLFKPEDVPERFWLRNGRTRSSEVFIDGKNLTNATEAKLFIATWNGNDGSPLFSSQLNDFSLPKFGTKYFYSLDTINIPLAELVVGTNDIEFTSTTANHGMEVLWPGPAIMVKGNSALQSLTIISQPKNVSVFEGDPATFTVEVKGSAPVSYQWKRNGVDIVSATEKSYTIPSAAIVNDGDVYSVEVSNSYGSVFSEDAKLSLNDLILNMPFAGNTSDISGYNNDGVSFAPSQFVTDLYNQTDQALLLDGEQYVEVPHDPSLSVETLTLAAWIWVDDYNDDQRIISKEFDRNPWSSYSLLMSGLNERYLQFRIGIGNQRLTLSSSQEIPLNQWVHAAATYDGNVMKLFIDGVLNSIKPASGPIQANNNPIYIGGSEFFDRAFEGKIDEVKIFNGALSEERVQLLVTENGPIPSVPESPSNLKAESLGVFPGDMLFKWEDNSSNESGFLVERQINGGGFVVVDTTATNISQYVDGTIEDGNTYDYRIIAFNGRGESPPSNVLTITVNDPSDQTPPVIEDISIFSRLDTASISWFTEELSIGEIRYGTSTNLDLSATDFLKKEHEIILRNLEPETTYFLKIISTDGSGNAVESAILSFTTEPIYELTSDDFNANAINTSLWEFEDPPNGSVLAMTGSQLELTVPAGTTHSLWTNGNNTARIMQRTSNVDFEVEVKIGTELTEDQFYGFLVKESETRWLRFDLAQDNGKGRLFSAFVNGGSGQVKLRRQDNIPFPVWLRLERVNDTWTFSYSADSLAWNTAVSYEQPLILSEVGLFVGNFGNNPVHTTAFDYFLVIENSDPLPVELLHFTAKPDNQFIQLSWGVASELNNDFYSIEKSKDGFTFTQLGKVSGAGTVDTAIEYEFRDEQPVPGLNFYRLSQTDYDGTTRSFPIEAVQFEGRYTEASKCYPNPLKGDELFIKTGTEFDQTPITLTLVDLSGKEVYLTTVEPENHFIKLIIPPTTRNGTYLLNISNGKYSELAKIVLRR